MKSVISKLFLAGASSLGLLLIAGWQPCAANPTTGPAAADTVQDADGNIYHTVKIGNQVWTVENLKTTKFNDGTPIAQVTDPGVWKELNTAAFCYYENKPEHGKTYGLLYNWHAASSDKIAPKGWRVPTIEEQFALRDYLIANGFNYDGTKEGNKIGKAMATKTEWPYLEKDAYGNAVPDLAGMIGNKPETNNKSGFSARPSGCRWNDGSFHAGETSVYWWSATPHDDSHACHTSLHTWFSKFGDNHHHQRSGFSIRLIRDAQNSVGVETMQQPASAHRAKSFGDPDKIDVLVVTSGHHFDRESFFGILKGDDITCSEYRNLLVRGVRWTAGTIQ